MRGFAPPRRGRRPGGPIVGHATGYDRPCAALTRLQDRHREGLAPPSVSYPCYGYAPVGDGVLDVPLSDSHPGTSAPVGEGLAPPAISHPCYGYVPVGDGVLDVPLSDSHPGTSAPVGEGLAPPDHSALRRQQNHGVQRHWTVGGMKRAGSGVLPALCYSIGSNDATPKLISIAAPVWFNDRLLYVSFCFNAKKLLFLVDI